MTPPPRPTPSPAQSKAIGAGAGPVLVLAGPGAGKTFCLIERIRFLVDQGGVDPERICALTFTNKAAEEVAARLRRELGPRADVVTRSTIHSLCVKILRTHGEALGLEKGFGIADEDYQKELLGWLKVPPRWRSNLLGRFGLARLGAKPLQEDDARTFGHYRAYLAKRGMIDFDDIVHRTKELFDRFPETAAEVAGRWDHLLVDEVQDLNPVQFSIVTTLGRAHGNVFVVGDDEQSIFSWTGADPRLIATFANEFRAVDRIVLDENRRTAGQIFALARRLISSNVPLFGPKHITATHESEYPVLTRSFPDEHAEVAWLLEDVQADRAASGLPWGEYAVLYRKHADGNLLEGALMQAGLPCRLAHGRALADDLAVRYLIAALKVITYPGDPVINEGFARVVLPEALCDALRKAALKDGIGFLGTLHRQARARPRTNEEGRKIRRALAAMQNLTALGQRHRHLARLVDEILSQRVGAYHTILEQRAEELSDPAGYPEVARLAGELERVRDARAPVLIQAMGGLEIGLAGMLAGAGIRLFEVTTTPPTGQFVLGPAWSCPDLGLALTVFKALQFLTATTERAAGNFVAVDLETTGRDVTTAEIVELGAVRVRDWEIVAEFRQLVKPAVPIEPGASATHHYSDADVANQPSFDEVWPRFKAFAASDELVAHNGYDFDFPILRRMSGDRDFVTYDTLPLAHSLCLGSAKLQHLAARFGIDPGTAHTALSDVRTLAQVYRKLEEEKVARARRVALSNVLDYLGISLALSDPDTLGTEAGLLRDITAVYALGRFSDCLEFYRAERDRWNQGAIPVDELIERLGGQSLMLKVRAEKRSDQRYPAAMARVRRLLEALSEETLEAEIQEFLSRVALSKSDGIETDQDRINLLTLHSTKGLEFSRVYIVGVEDAEMPGLQSLPSAERRAPSAELEESRRLLYVGMTRAKERLVMTRVEARAGKLTGGHRFLDEMGLAPA